MEIREEGEPVTRFPPSISETHVTGSHIFNNVLKLIDLAMDFIESVFTRR